MKSKRLAMFIMFLMILFSSKILLADITLKTLDYAQLKKYLPEGWVIKRISIVTAPHAWTRTNGSKGLQVFLECPSCIDSSYDEQGDNHPWYSFTLLPLDWEGITASGATFRDGTITAGQLKSKGGQKDYSPDHFSKKFPQFYFFDFSANKGDWIDPLEDLSKYLKTIQ